MVFFSTENLPSCEVSWKISSPSASRPCGEGDEAGVDELDAVDVLRDELGEELLGDVGRLLGRGGLPAGKGPADRGVAPLEVGVALVPDGDQLDVDAGGGQFAQTRLRLLDDVGVVAAAQPAVAGDDDEKHLLRRALLEQREVGEFRGEAVDEIAQHLLQHLGKRTRAQHGVLRAPHLGRRHQPHGVSNLLRVLHGTHAVPHLPKVRRHPHRNGRIPRARLAHRRSGGRRRDKGGSGAEGRTDKSGLHRDEIFVCMVRRVDEF